MIPVPIEALKLAAERRGERAQAYLADAWALSSEDGPCRTFTAGAYEELRKRHPRGAGDIVERFAKPIARAIDAFLGSNLEHCQGCGDRRDALNAAIPFQ